MSRLAEVLFLLSSLSFFVAVVLLFTGGQLYVVAMLIGFLFFIAGEVASSRYS